MKKFWGIFPILTFVVLKLVLFMIEKSVNLVLRDTPAFILFWFLILSILVFVIFVIIKIFSLKIIKKSKFSKIIKNFIILLYSVGSLVALLTGLFFSTFSYCSEEIVIENGTKMVVRDTSYLGFSEEYYKYQNIFFRGKQLLKEIKNKTYFIYNSNGDLIETGIYDN